MKRYVNITLQFDLAIGSVNLNEIVFQLKEIQNPLMLKILESILMSYDELICERLSNTKALSQQGQERIRSPFRQRKADALPRAKSQKKRVSQQAEKDIHGIRRYIV